MKDFFLKKTTSDFKSPKDFWKFYSLIIKTKKSHSECKIANITDPVTDITYSESVDIANTLNQFFTNIKEENDVSLETSKDFINEKFRANKQNDLLNTSSFSFEKFTEEKVIEAIKSLDSSSSEV